MAFSADKLRQGAAGVAGDSYSIDNSLRFNDNDSAYLSRTPSSAGNRKTWTWSGWVKLPKSFSGPANTLFAGYVNGSNRLRFNFIGDGKIEIFGFTAGANINLTSTASYRDSSSWYHFVWAMDTTQSTETERMKVYVNGQQVTDFTSTNYPAEDSEPIVNGNFGHYIGQRGDSYAYLEGYQADVHFLDGHAVNPDTFGEFNRYGQWVAKTPTFANPSFDDGSPSNHKVELNGNVQTTIGKYGQGFAFDGSGDYLSVPDSSDWDFGTGDFTVEGWLYQNGTHSSYDGFITFADSSNNSVGIGIGYDTAGNIAWYSHLGNAVKVVFSTAPSINAWHHIAVSRSNGTT